MFISDKNFNYNLLIFRSICVILSLTLNGSQQVHCPLPSHSLSHALMSELDLV